MALPPRLRDRLSGAVVDPAPLRRAGLLAVALVVLLVAGRAFGPDAASSRAPSERQTLHPQGEQVAAPASMWTGGRVLAVVLLLASGSVALVLRRRTASSAPPAAPIDVLGTHALGPGQSLRLVGCGDEVLLLSVSGDGARLLRHWPRADFEGAPVEDGAPSFAQVLAAASPAPEEAPSALEEAPPADSLAPSVLEVASSRTPGWPSSSLPQFGAHA